jgi:hypothetical protein
MHSSLNVTAGMILLDEEIAQTGFPGAPSAWCGMSAPPRIGRGLPASVPLATRVMGRASFYVLVIPPRAQVIGHVHNLQRTRAPMALITVKPALGPRRSKRGVTSLIRRVIEALGVSRRPARSGQR